MNERYIVCFLCVFASIQCICLVVVTSSWSSVRKSISERVNKETEIHYQQKTLQTHHKYPDGIRSMFDEERNITAVSGPGGDLIKSIVSEAIDDLFNDAAHPEQSALHESFHDETCKQLTEDNPTLKLVDINDTKANLDGETSKIFWKTVSQSYSHSGLAYTAYKDLVIFENPGLYFITSQIQFHLNGTRAPDSAVNIKYLVHLISYKTGKETIILQNEKTLCEPTTPHLEQTISVGAIFNFDAHDQLYVSTSLPKELVTNGNRSHLTIFVL